MLFRQLFESVSSTYTYLLACSRTGQAILVDPVLNTLDRDAELVHQLSIQLVYGVNTHVHADHVTATGSLKRNEYFPDMQSVLPALAHGRADRLVVHGDRIHFGDEELEVRATPGHTNGCATYVSHGGRFALTGDALLIRGCGRTDFQEGDARTLYRSVHAQILSLPHDYRLYPAHDYRGRTVTTVGEEIKWNPRLSRSEDEFVEVMHNLCLARPEQIDCAVPANLLCGLHELMDEELRQKVFK